MTWNYFKNLVFSAQDQNAFSASKCQPAHLERHKVFPLILIIKKAEMLLDEVTNVHK
jgi:hypothetical protein